MSSNDEMNTMTEKPTIADKAAAAAAAVQAKMEAALKEKMEKKMKAEAEKAAAKAAKEAEKEAEKAAAKAAKDAEKAAAKAAKDAEKEVAKAAKEAEKAEKPKRPVGRPKKSVDGSGAGSVVSLEDGEVAPAKTAPAPAPVDERIVALQAEIAELRTRLAAADSALQTVDAIRKLMSA
jgi:hypothetical protein